MEEQQHHQGHDYITTTMTSPETKDCKEEKSQEDVPIIDLEMVDKHEGTELKEKHTLLEELQRTRSNNLSSFSDEEVEEGGETKKRKKKGLKDKIKDKIKEKISGEKGEEYIDQMDAYIAIEEGNAKVENGETTNSEEKKGFPEKVKEKLPGQHKKTEEGTATPPNREDSSGGETKEKKGIWDKIKEKLPGHHKTEDEPKEKDN